jgi:recombination protein RecT
MSNDVAVRPSTEIQRDESPGQIVSFLTARISQLAKCCPSGITPEAMIQVASLIVRKTPKLQECDPATIFTSMLDAGSLGFSLNTVQGECYLIPRFNKNTGKTECSMQPGYRGLAKLVRGNGKVEYIVAHVVHKNDVFKVALAPEPVITHEPCLTGDRGPMIAVYSMVKFISGSVIYDYMLKEDVEKIRKTSQSPNGNFWSNHYDEMAKKTILKRHAKSLDQSPELAKAIELDNVDFQIEEATPRAIVDNGTGFGRGDTKDKMSTPEDKEAYLAAITPYVEQRKSQWLDRWTKNGEVPEKLYELTRLSLCDKHLAEYAEKTRMIEPGSLPEGGQKAHQEGRFASIPFMRSKDECNRLKKELKRFIDEQEEIATARLQVDHPELFAREPGDDDDDDMSDLATME